MMSFAFEASGNIRHPSAAELQEADDAAVILTFTRFMLADGRPWYVYLAVPPSRFSEFRATVAERKAMVPTDYGIILAEGYTIDPPQAVVDEMRERFGFDEHYEENVVQEAVKQQDTLIKKKEEKRIGNIISMLKHTPKGSAN